MWEMEWCDSDKTSKIQELLNINWEPFAVSNKVIYFRRKKSTPSVPDMAHEEKDYLIRTGVIKGEIIGGE
jgi:hypothetical protein